MSDVVDFESPPVKHVRLTLYFKHVDDLRASHLSSLREEWRSEYPDVNESPPFPGHELAESSAIVGVDESWTMPQVAYSNPIADREVALQSDRFSVGWRFSEAQTERYPGFESLRAELEGRFAKFAEVVEQSVGSILEIVGSECRYMNHMEELTASELIVGVLTGWEHRTAKDLGPTVYAGARVHWSPSAERAGCTVLVGIDANEDEAPMLWIAVEHELQEDRDTPIGGLDCAHEELVATFMRITNEDQHTAWGMRS